VVISFLWWGMSITNLYAKDTREQVLKVRIPGDMRYDTLFDTVFARFLRRYNLISVETVQAGTQTELIYGIELKKQDEAQNLLDELRKVNDNNKVSLLTGHHEVDL
jgi:archaellum biogenesis ATPase FlaH